MPTGRSNYILAVNASLAHHEQDNANVAMKMIEMKNALFDCEFRFKVYQAAEIKKKAKMFVNVLTSLTASSVS